MTPAETTVPFSRGWREVLLAREQGAQSGIEGAPELETDAISATLPTEISAALHKWSGADSERLASAVRAVWGLMLARYTGEPEMRVIHARITQGDIADTVDIGGLVDRAQVGLVGINGSESFEAWLTRIREEEGQLAVLRTNRIGPCAAPLQPADIAGTTFLVVVSAESDAPLTPLDAAGIARVSGFPVVLVVSVGTDIELQVGFRPARIDRFLAEQIPRHMATALAAILGNPGQQLDEVPLLDAAQRTQILKDWNRTGSEYHAGSTLPLLFGEQVRRSSDAIAVISEEGSLSYQELDARANQLARFLMRHGAGPGVPIALCLKRSLDSVKAILAILKTGGLYVPLEGSFPHARLEFMLRDVGAKLLLTESAVAERIPTAGLPVVLLDSISAELSTESAENPETLAGKASDLAYVMYTSGSTGMPKGVEITHRAINRLVCNVDYVKLDESRTVLHVAPLGFDASTFEIWGALLTGGRCAVYPDGVPTPEGIGEVISKYGVTTSFLTTGLFNSIVDDSPAHLRGMIQVLTGGEAASATHFRRALDALPELELINAYGPTETTTFAASYSVTSSWCADAKSIPIGKPIRDTRLYVLDKRRQPVPIGVEGELYIGGEGVARGYVGRPDLSAERFVADPFTGSPHDRMYKTGDLVRYLPDGSVDFIGRVDTQVKISGYRIELSEIESALLAHPAVRSGVVTVRPGENGESKQLVSYLVKEEGQATPDPRSLREHVRRTLPEYMVPAAFVWLQSLPLTGNGKVDTRALPDPQLTDYAIDANYVAPRSDIESQIADTWARLLRVSRVSVLENVFELGANSLIVLKALAVLRREHNIVVPIVNFFRYPTVSELAASIATSGAAAIPVPVADPSNSSEPSRRASRLSDPIAIIGMSGRFPGSSNVAEFWNNLRDNRETVSRFTADDLDVSVETDVRGNPQYVPVRGVLRDVDKFDAGFFGMSAREAQLMDPQQRLFLELSWEALEHAGYVPENDTGPIGVFAGVYFNSYVPTVLSRRPDLVNAFGAFNATLLNEKDFVAARASHRLGLTGPALSIHTACSTSLVTICQAVQSLRSSQCDLALAGGVSLTLPTNTGHLYQEGSMLSMDGSTRTFDINATGTVFSDGAGVVVLKRLADAERDGDRIYAVIRGIGVNNDGANKASFTAPSVDGQAAVIRMAQADAGIHPRSISYLEAHGTATPLGDPIEVEALRQVFESATSEKQFCGIGSVKSNIGHTVIAAGAAGVIKTALALTDEWIPPTLHFTAANTNIDFKSSPFFVVATGRPWPRGGSPRRAGVSSFGVGGTNAHVVLEEAPLRPESGPSRRSQLLVISARTASALENATNDLAGFLVDHPEANFADVAFTLKVGRKSFQHRRSIAATSSAEAVEALATRDERRLITKQAPPAVPDVAFMFPGQGAQYVGMGASLYVEEAVFREAMDRCAAAAQPVLGFDIRDVLFQSDDDVDAESALRQTSVTQPALFAIEYSLAVLWQSWGIKPRAMIGHSVGEFVCAALAGVFTPEDAMRLVAERGRLMQALPAGAMLSVRQGAAKIAPRLSADLSIASDNSPSLCVVSGPFEAVAELQGRLEADGVSCRLLQTSHAFHSPMMDPAVDAFAAVLSGVTFKAPLIPFVSTASGDWITAEQAQDPNYWARHLRETVRFSAGVQTLLAKGPTVLIEVGPRATLSTLARQQIADKRTHLCIASLGPAGDRTTESTSLASALGEAWASGITPNWTRYYSDEKRYRVPLPTYPFERLRFWADPAEKPAIPVAAPAVSVSTSEIRVAVSERPAPAPVKQLQPPTSVMPTQVNAAESRRDRLIPALRELLEQVSGEETGADAAGSSFVELGFDSLVLTQVAMALSKAYGVKITFRQLLEEHTSVLRLAEYLDKTLAPETTPPAVLEAVVPAPEIPVAQFNGSSQPVLAVEAIPSMPNSVSQSAMQQLVEQQLRVMAQQLALLSGAGVSSHNIEQKRPEPVTSLTPISGPAAAPIAAAPSEAAKPGSPGPVAATPEDFLSTGPNREVYDAKKAFGAAPRITITRSDDFSPKQRTRFDAFVRRYTARTQSSKRFTQKHRAEMADPRVATGFRPATKELVYPLVMERSQGSRMWDLDGNEYIDVLSGFGSNFFGWSPPFVLDAVRAQLEKGFDVGPQHPLAGEVAELFCELTHNERAAFCNTGSEAVLGAIRIARTVTGRDLIVIFTGSYHGINDEVIVRGTKKLGAVPAAPGIMAATAKNVLVLDYGTPESLEIIKSRASQIAAVVVEPVQSRRPDFQPKEFLQDLRNLTQSSGIVYIWDEIVTGFRAAPRGAQEIFGIQPDLSTYGKIVGGGLPIGVIAGRRQFMDALDGGSWQFGDQSVPEVGVTYFAGTFVRHPLALAAAKAVLLYLKARGPALQQEVSERTRRLASELNEYFVREGAPIEIKFFSSVWKTFFKGEHQNSDLFFYMLRDRGIHIYDGFPCFMTAAHTDADISRIASAFKEAFVEMRESGFIAGAAPSQQPDVLDSTRPPVPGARLGRDQEGKLSWFVTTETGRYAKVGSPSVKK
jgi:amino acid adenylation domain-containing protein